MKPPILRELPMPLTTKRLLIRPPQAGDGAAQLDAQTESRRELRDWMPWAQSDPTLDGCEEVMRRAHAKWILREDLVLLLFDRATKQFLGGSGLHRIKWDVPAFEIGYWLRTSRVGTGIVTESTAAITQYAFKALGAKRVEIKCDPDNTRSAAIPLRLGYRLEATLAQDYRTADGSRVRDTLLYVRTNADGLPDVGASW